MLQSDRGEIGVEAAVVVKRKPSRRCGQWQTAVEVEGGREKQNAGKILRFILTRLLARLARV